jgi:GH15 family glucan-1,4-alpha-glucosidase
VSTKPKAEETRPQSAAAPSPFTPIADYAFLSDCHTGALVAPDGAVDWLCVPRFDAPSVFGSLLDRGAGTFRFGPFSINHPSARQYEPGSNVLVTTWKTPAGWVVVRDALTMGPTDHEDTVTPHTRPPGQTPSATGAGGSVAPAFPIMSGGTRSNALRWRSRA